MRSILSCSIVAAGIAFAFAGCDKDTVTKPPVDCTDFSTDTSTRCSSLCGVANESFCGDNGATLDCADVRAGALVDVCGVPLQTPPKEGETILALARSSEVEEFSGSGPPDLSCFEPSGFPSPPGTPQDVTISGIVKVFSHGCDTAEVDVVAHTVIRDGSVENDGMPGDVVDSTVTGADCVAEGEPEQNDDCVQYPAPAGEDWLGARYECTYSLVVPSETELLIITSGSGWAQLYEYNVYVPNDEVVDGVFEKDVRAIVQDDYNVIPQVAIGKTMEPGNGAIGGEVHDCNNVRLTNAIVDVDQDRELTYFTDDETTPLPDRGAKSTSILGLYSALDVREGPITVAAGGYDGEQLVGIGVFRARIHANAVTSVTFRGLRPFQLP